MDESRTWDAMAGRYDRIVRLFDRSYPAIRARLRAELAGAERVIELAAGTGQFTRALAAAAHHVLATDVSPEMVARLTAAVTGAGVTNVEFATMSAYQLAVDDHAFDAALCANALHVMEEPARALAEIARALKPGGRLIAPTFLHGADLGRRALSRLMSAVSPFVAHTRLDAASLRALVEDAGYTVTRLERLPGLFPIAYLVATPRA